MNKFEAKKMQLRELQEKELAELDLQRLELGDSKYWQLVSEVYKKYTALVDEVESEERSRESVVAAKENTDIDKRPELSYSDVLGQMKARKETELLLKLSRVESSRNNAVTAANISREDPFYQDKLDPLSVFNRWWFDFLQTLPSVDEVQAFLKKIDISEYGAIYVKDLTVTDIQTHESREADVSLLKNELFKPRKEIKKEQKQLDLRKKRLKRPMLNKLSEYKSSKPIRDQVADLRTIVDAYDLPPYTTQLLYDHIEKCCVPKGLLHVDEYQNMLEQFLRNVYPQQRDSTIAIAIEKGWRKLYYVN